MLEDRLPTYLCGQNRLALPADIRDAEIVPQDADFCMFSPTSVSLSGFASNPLFALAGFGPMPPMLLDGIWGANLVFAIVGALMLVRYATKGDSSHLAEAAKLDGLGGWSLYRQVYLPRLAPIFGTLILLILVCSFDDVMAAIVEWRKWTPLPSDSSSPAVITGLVAGINILATLAVAALASGRANKAKS